jgi:hypothetical protein
MRSKPELTFPKLAANRAEREHRGIDEIVKVFGFRPFIDHCCPPGQGRRSKTSKEGNRESEGRRRRRDLWGFKGRSLQLSSGGNDYQK